MATEEIPDETTVEDDWTVRIPERVRERLDVDPGDKIRWVVTDEGELSVEVVEQEYGVFEDAKTVSLGDVPDDALGMEN